MKRLTSFLVLGSAVVASAANWPARVFAPYMYIGAGDHFQITECDDACGQKFYTIPADRLPSPLMTAWRISRKKPVLIA